MAGKNQKVSVTRRFHRSTGVGAAVFILFMVMSGLVINHSNQLDLDQQQITKPFLLNWYGLKEPQAIHSFAIDNDWLSFAGSQLYFNGISVSTISNGVGAVAVQDMIIAAGDDELLLFNNKGQIIERIDWDTSSAGPIDSIGQLADGTVAVRSSRGVWLADAEFLGWQRADDNASSPQWSISKPTPGDLRQTVIQHYSGGLSLEQLLLDMHSGRIFGTIGIVVYDLLAIVVGFMAISGLILWVRGRRKSKRNGKGV